MRRRALVSLPALAVLGGTVGQAAAGDPAAAAPAEAAPAGTAPAEAATLAEPAEAVGTAAAAAGASGAFESPAVIDGNLPVFFEALKEELTFPLAWGTSRIRDFHAWQRAARRTVEEHLLQPADRTPFDMEVLDEQPADGYVQRAVVFNVTRYSRVRAVLLVPDGAGPFPAALLLHDHGAKFDIGKEKLVQPWYDATRLASAQAWAAKYFTGRFVGNELAARGYVVLCVDALGWGDRSGLAYDGQQALASNFFNLGSSVAGLMAREDVRAAALLASLSEVDKSRVAAVGFSMGGYRAWQLAALSDQIRAAVSVCWMTTLKDMMVPGNNTLRGQSSFYMLHPGLFRYLDIPDVASIAAPRPMLFFEGADDPLFSPVGVASAYDRMRSVWRSRGADDRLTTKVWPGLGHVFVEPMQEEAFAWLDRALAGHSG